MIFNLTAAMRGAGPMMGGPPGPMMPGPPPPGFMGPNMAPRPGPPFMGPPVPPGPGPQVMPPMDRMPGPIAPAQSQVPAIVRYDFSTNILTILAQI